MTTLKTLTIGRSPDCDWTVDDEYASLRHATITQRVDGSLWLMDAGTTNGTYLNGRRVWAPVYVFSGDRIKVGRTELVVP